jgi:hypothetical protein
LGNSSLATYHGKGGLLTVSGPDYVEGERLGETLIRAANEMGFNRIDLNARYSEGRINIQHVFYDNFNY